jgi:hypothetical protein
MLRKAMVWSQSHSFFPSGNLGEMEKIGILGSRRCQFFNLAASTGSARPTADGPFFGVAGANLRRRRRKRR